MSTSEHGNKPRISDYDKQRVKAGADVVRVLHALGFSHARYGPNFKCVFPEHEDHKPSCHAYRQSASIKCFACDRHADVFALVMLFERCEFPDAVRRVAQICGIPL